MSSASIIKTVFCSYRGILIVYDTIGNKVDELCGEVTLEKASEIDKRINKDITEFDGKEHYNNAVEKLIKEKEEKELQEKKEQKKQRQAGINSPDPLPKNKLLKFAIIGLVVIVALPAMYYFAKKFRK